MVHNNSIILRGLTIGTSQRPANKDRKLKKVDLNHTEDNYLKKLKAQREKKIYFTQPINISSNEEIKIAIIEKIIERKNEDKSVLKSHLLYGLTSRYWHGFASSEFRSIEKRIRKAFNELVKEEFIYFTPGKSLDLGKKYGNNTKP